MIFYMRNGFIIYCGILLSYFLFNVLSHLLLFFYLFFHVSLMFYVVLMLFNVSLMVFMFSSCFTSVSYFINVG